jgi:1-acyl-sn-glycerol-3-phosphate acyltransferase
MAVSGRDRRERRRKSGVHELSVRVTLRYRFAVLIGKPILHSVFRLRAEGLEHWPRPPFQIVANHHNGFDPILVMAVAPLTPRTTWFGPKEKDFSRGIKNRIMGFFGGVIPYDPDKVNLTSAVRAVRRVFAADGVLAIFAEGKVGFRETALQPFEPGAVVFATTAGVPIVPCAVVGSTYLYLGRRITVRYGEPIPTVGVRSAEARRELEQRVRAAIEALLPEEEPPLPRVRPLFFLTDLLNGPEVPERRIEEGVAQQA